MSTACINKHKLRLFLYLSVITVSFVSSFLVFVTVIRPVFVQRLQYYTHMAATELINSAISEALSEENFSDLIELNKNSDGAITSLSANTAKMNILRTEVTKALEESLKETNSQYITVPLGSMLGNELFAGVGPDVKIKICPVGAADIDFFDNFEACGINQTRHTLSLIVSLDIAISAPQINTSSKISAKLPVAETVIVGNVPKYYGMNFNTAFEE